MLFLLRWYEQSWTHILTTTAALIHIASYLRTIIHFKETKCVLLRFCSKDAPIDSTYVLNNNVIPVKEFHKDLGIVFSSDLSFSAHYDNYDSQASLPCSRTIKEDF